MSIKNRSTHVFPGNVHLARVCFQAATGKIVRANRLRGVFKKIAEHPVGLRRELETKGKLTSLSVSDALIRMLEEIIRSGSDLVIKRSLQERNRALNLTMQEGARRFSRTTPDRERRDSTKSGPRFMSNAS